MKLSTAEAKQIITDIAFDESRIQNKECEALRCGVRALSAIEKIRKIIHKRDIAFDGQEFGASYTDLDNVIEEIRKAING